MSRLGQTIGAVLSLTQWSMVFFADAYVPHKLRSRVLKRRAKKRQPPPRAQVAPCSEHAPSSMAQSPSLEMPSIMLSSATMPSPGGLDAASSYQQTSPRVSAAPSGSGRGGGGGGGGGSGASRAAKPADDPHERMSELFDQASVAPHQPHAVLIPRHTRHAHTTHTPPTRHSHATHVPLHIP